MSKLIISCSNCGYKNNICDDGSLYVDCLEYSTSDYKHPKYPEYRIFWYKYKFWKPENKIDCILTDEDFKI